jgi:hypothetical protein
LAGIYLKKLTETASPALQKELSLELALTKMAAAGEEADSVKRIALYAEARGDFQKFLQANPNHPRAAEARLDIARATTLQGKTELNRAQLEGDKQTRIADGLKARATLANAFDQLKKLLPSAETELAKAEAELAMALNLLDQADTYLNTESDTELAARSKVVQEAQKILDKLAQGDSNSKITWTARAWAGRCLDRLDDPNKALEKYFQVTGATGAAAREGNRLARYFILLARQKLKKAPDTGAGGKPQALDEYLVGRCQKWLQDYPSYKRTPEGYGVRFLLAENLLVQSENTKLDQRTRDTKMALARDHLRFIEQTENDFTDRARRLKLAVMDKQGTFKQPISKLKTFEDCYVRAQYEQMQIGEDANKYKDDPKKAEDARKEHFKAILEALQNGLKKPDAKKNKESSIDVNNARALLTYYLLNEGKYQEAIAIGEDFAKNNPKAGQASMAAIYALLAYGELLGEQERKIGDAKLLQDNQQYQADKTRMMSLATLMEQRWPTERAGDLARHQIALRLLREDKTAEAIDKLRAITPTYPSYIRTQFLLARTELQQAEQDKEDAKGYRKHALAALIALKAPATPADADVNREYIQGKLMLASEFAREKKFKELDALVADLTPKMESLPVMDDAEKNTELRGKFKESLLQMSLYSTTLQADADFKAAKYDEVVKRLDPLVNQFNTGKLPQLKDSQLAAPMLALALKADVQLNKLDRAKEVIKALQALQSDKGDKGGDKGTTAILAQLVKLISQQVEDLRKKGDKDKLDKAKAGFTIILNEVAGGQKTPTPQLAYLLAKCYAGMDEHKKAVDLLEKFAAEEGKGEEVKLHHAIQLLLIEEYRQLKDADKARKLLDEILGTAAKPGWGARDLEAQKRRIMLLEDKGDYRQGALLAERFVQQLLPRIDDNRFKEQYFEFYYHLVYCIFKHGQGQSAPMQKAKYIKDAAHRIIILENRQGGFGSEESKKLFEGLLEKEAELRTEYQSQKGGK